MSELDRNLIIFNEPHPNPIICELESLGFEVVTDEWKPSEAQIKRLFLAWVYFYDCIKQPIKVNQFRQQLRAHAPLIAWNRDAPSYKGRANWRVKLTAWRKPLCNAGEVRLGKIVHRVSTPHGGNLNSGNFPHQVQALDENFILLKRSANPGISSDLAGFHMYGLDLFRGHHAYVVDFHLTPLGKGTRDVSFYQQRDALIDKYQRVFAPAWRQTTCTSLFVSGSRWLNNLLNSPTPIKWAKSVAKRRDKARK